MNVPLKCPVQSRTPARFEKALESWVNHDVYYFSDSRAKERFDATPWKWAGRLTDPVMHVRFKPTRRSVRAEYQGRPYLFVSDSTRTVFLGDPERYFRARAMGEMAAADSAARADSLAAQDAARAASADSVETSGNAGR